MVVINLTIIRPSTGIQPVGWAEIFRRLTASPSSKTDPPRPDQIKRQILSCLSRFQIVPQTCSFPKFWAKDLKTKKTATSRWLTLIECDLPIHVEWMEVKMYPPCGWVMQEKQLEEFFFGFVLRLIVKAYSSFFDTKHSKLGNEWITHTWNHHLVN